MKPFLLITNFLLLAIIFFQSFQIKQQVCNANICNNYTGRPFRGNINAKSAAYISKLYSKDSAKRYIWMNPRMIQRTQDARSIWFSVEDIKRFIWNIEHASCTNRCNGELGIRIYYAKYPTRATMDGLGTFEGFNQAYANMHSLFAVPTIKRPGALRHVDFNPFNRCGGFNYSSTTDTISRYAIMFLSGDAQNHGGLAPPPEEDGTFGND